MLGISVVEAGPVLDAVEGGGGGLPDILGGHFISYHIIT